MAAGRYGGYRDRELRDRDADLVSSRRNDYFSNGDPHRDRYHGRERDLRDKLRASRRRDNKQSDSRHSLSGRSSNSDAVGKDCVAGVASERSVIDREPGELSSGSRSGSDDPEEIGLKENLSMEHDNGVVPSPNKKQKYSPIVWDRDDSMENKHSEYSSKSFNLSRRSSEQSKNCFHAELDVAVAVLPTEVHVSPQHSTLHDHDPDLGQGETDDDDFTPARHISSSRWADGNDDEVVGADASTAVIVPRKRKSPSSADPMEKQSRTRLLSPEFGEIIFREGSEGATSKSSGSRGDNQDDYQEMDVDKKADVDVDIEDDDKCNAVISDTDSDNDDSQDERAKTHDLPQTPQRCINMLKGCRSVDEFERLNKIDEGTYGVVYRAKDKKTGDIVALKKVKMEKEREGFPLTSLREINILLSFHHPSIVDVKEVVVGSSLDSIFMVMEYMEHDLKGLMETMKQPFSQSEVKCLMLQLLEGVKYLRDNWVLHRDLKTSNLLLNNRGELKICDFGLSRQYGSPLKPYTHLVVTLWYRAPELLLGAKEYSTAIDMWSLGCIMAELLAKEPLFNGKTEFDQLDKIFRILGTPNEEIWPLFPKLPGVKVNFVKQPYNRLRGKFPPTSFSGRPTLSEAGFDLLNKLLTYDPEKRITAEDALKHSWFREVPLPKSKDFMPTFPAQHAQDRRLRRIMKSPDPLEEQRRRELQQGGLGTGGLFG